MFGHGVFIYDPQQAKAKYGTWEAVADAILGLDMSHAWIRLHNKDGLWRVPENKALASALKARGLTVFGWGWCDGNAVDRDLANVESALSEFSPDGYVADIEHGVSGAHWTTSRIEAFCSKARQLVAGKPFLVSSFGFLPYHEPHLMRAADAYVDAFAPQVYWFWFPKEAMFDQPGATGDYQTNNAADYASLCIDVWRHVVRKPLVLTGQAYWGEASGWTQPQAERKLQEFIDGFDRYDEIVGLNWWHLAGDKTMSSDMAARIAAAQLGSRLAAPDAGARPTPTPTPAGERAYVRADALNLRTTPGDDPSTVIIALDIGQPVDVLGPSDVAGWKRVSAEVGDRMYEGHVFGNTCARPKTTRSRNSCGSLTPNGSGFSEAEDPRPPCPIPPTSEKCGARSASTIATGPIRSIPGRLHSSPGCCGKPATRTSYSRHCTRNTSIRRSAGVSCPSPGLSGDSA